MKIQVFVVLVLAVVDLFTVLAVEKPGQCPEIGDIKGGNCDTDYDCKGLDKCCQGTCSRPECPDKSEPCTPDSCQLATCDTVPRAYCVQDPCSCKATWFTDDEGDVTALCTTDEGDMQIIAQNLWYTVNMLGDRSKRSAYASGWKSLKNLRKTAKALRKKQREIARAIKRERRKKLNTNTTTISEIDQITETTTSGAGLNATTVKALTTTDKPVVMNTTVTSGGMKKKQKKDKKKRKQERMKKKEAKRKRKEERQRRRKEKLSRRMKKRN